MIIFLVEKVVIFLVEKVFEGHFFS
jgi:hypothetical protein